MKAEERITQFLNKTWHIIIFIIIAFISSGIWFIYIQNGRLDISFEGWFIMTFVTLNFMELMRVRIQESTDTKSEIP